MNSELDKTLDVTEELDFHYLLTIMPTLYEVSAFSWLPELFAIIGHDKLIKLCKYAGGETIQIPTLEELSDAIESLQMYYDVYIKRVKSETDIPVKHKDMVKRIVGTLNA